MRKMAEKCFIVLLLLYYTNPFVNLFLSEEIGNTATAGPATNKAWGLALQFVMNGIAALILITRWRTLLRGLRQALWVAALPALACISVLWSADPLITLRRAIIVAAGTLFGAYLGARYSRGELIRMLAWLMLCIAVLSIAFVALLPSLGVARESEHAGDWQGIFHQKNMLGRIMTLGTLVCLFWRPQPAVIVAKIGGLIVCAALVVLSGSMTAIAALTVLVMAVALFKTFELRATVAIPIWMLFSMAALTLLFLLARSGNDLLSILGRDSTLTGRTQLWQAVMQAVWHRPWLGYGLEGFWRGMEGESSAVFLVAPWATFSHNGMLELWLQFGIVGLGVFSVGFLYVFQRALQCARHETGMERLWPLTYLTFQVVFNLTETSGMINNIFWLLYISVASSPSAYKSDVGSEFEIVAAPERGPLFPNIVPARPLLR
jgi:exopolysaccharide production protein ExoQ